MVGVGVGYGFNSQIGGGGAGEAEDGRMGAQFSLLHAGNINRAFKQRNIQSLTEKSPVGEGGTQPAREAQV